MEAIGVLPRCQHRVYGAHLLHNCLFVVEQEKRPSILIACTFKLYQW